MDQNGVIYQLWTWKTLKMSIFILELTDFIRVLILWGLRLQVSKIKALMLWAFYTFTLAKHEKRKTRTQKRLRINTWWNAGIRLARRGRVITFWGWLWLYGYTRWWMHLFFHPKWKKPSYSLRLFWFWLWFWAFGILQGSRYHYFKSWLQFKKWDLTLGIPRKKHAGMMGWMQKLENCIPLRLRVRLHAFWVH